MNVQKICFIIFYLFLHLVNILIHHSCFVYRNLNGNNHNNINTHYNSYWIILFCITGRKENNSTIIVKAWRRGVGVGEKRRGNFKNRNWSPSGLTRIPTRHIHRSLLFKINLGPTIGWNCDPFKRIYTSHL